MGLFYPSEDKGQNHHRAGHIVNVIPGCRGYNVQLPYRGYTISLGMDGETTAVWKGDGDFLFQSLGTDGESIRQAMNYVDNVEREQDVHSIPT